MVFPQFCAGFFPNFPCWMGRPPLAVKRGPALIPRRSKGDPGTLLLLPSPNFLALEVVAGALPRPISKRMKRKGEKGLEGGGGPRSGGGGGGDGGEWIPPGSSMLRRPRLTKRSRGKGEGGGSPEPPTDPGASSELPPSSGGRGTGHRTCCSDSAEPGALRGLFEFSFAGRKMPRKKALFFPSGQKYFGEFLALF